jgi:hypothetical protein
VIDVLCLGLEAVVLLAATLVITPSAALWTRPATG